MNKTEGGEKKKEPNENGKIILDFTL